MDLEVERLVVGMDEAEQQGFGSGSGSVFDGEAQTLIGAAAEIAGGVGPGVEVGASAQRLAGILAGSFGHVVDEGKGEVMTAIELAEESEEAGDVGGTVFVEVVEADQGVEEAAAGLEEGEGLVEGGAGGGDLEAAETGDGGGDGDGQIESQP
jgi:hypothetical protein